jgi:hypothetical protein
LSEHNVPLTEKVKTMIRRTEAGDVPSFNEFGKEVLRQTYGTQMVNSVDKVNLNDDYVVNPSHSGVPFGLVSNELKEETLDSV